MENVLFVDDESRILEGLKRTFRRKGRDWQMRFASGADEALDLLKESPATVVVSDMKMPGRDGADLLSEVKQLYPDAVRVILSGHSEIELVMKSVGISHQYLSKPCEPENLENTIKRAQDLRNLLNNPTLAELVARIDTIPSMPTAYQKIVECLQCPDSGIEDVAEIISTDIGMTAKILKLVNSAYFGLAKPVTSVQKAVFVLGLETIVSLVLSHEVFTRYEQAGAKSFRADALASYTAEVGALARLIAKHENLDRSVASDAFTAAMLHDAGKLVLAIEFAETYECVLQESGGQADFDESIERGLLGTTHAEVGAYLIGLWGLPDSIVNAVAYHEHPSQCPVREFGPLGVVHVASRIVLNQDESDITAITPCLDVDYLDDLGLLHKWPEWQALWRNTKQNSNVS